MQLAAVAGVLALGILTLPAACATAEAPGEPPGASAEDGRNGAPEGGRATGPTDGDRESDIPDWYLNPSEAYPDERYITAVGSGESRRAAEEAAFAGLAQVFEVDIEVDTTTRERYREIVTEEGRMSEQEVELAQTTDIRAAEQLLNVQTGEAAVDDEGRVRTIAYIERHPTGRIYADLIEENEALVLSLRDEAEAGEDPLHRYAYLNAARTIARKNEALLEQLRIISPAIRNSVSVSYDYSDIAAAHADAATRIHVNVDVTGDSGERISSSLREALNSRHFAVTGDAPVLEVSAEVEMEPVELNPEFETVRWTLDVTLRRDAGPVIAAFGENGRASGITVEEARALAYTDMEEIVDNTFVEALSSYFDGLVLDE